jgi:hypothetical protein
MWIVALYIDQGNLQERGAQIRFMATIYLYASCIVVWLGEANDSTCVLADVETAFQKCKLLAEFYN